MVVVESLIELRPDLPDQQLCQPVVPALDLLSGCQVCLGDWAVTSAYASWSYPAQKVSEATNRLLSTVARVSIGDGETACHLPCLRRRTTRLNTSKGGCRMATKLVKDQAREDAEQVLLGYWDDGYPVDPVEIAQGLGIKVWTARLPSDVAGELVQEAGKPAEIYLNENDSDVRQTFTCAHEVGHYWERSQRNDKEYSFVDRRGEAPPSDPHEWYADHFAANLLMPEDEFRRKVEAGYTPAKLASHFAVSRQAVATRMRSLGLVT